jgi:hypothetical protein
LSNQFCAAINLHLFIYLFIYLKQETAVTPAISISKDDSNNMIAYNSRNASNSRKEGNNRTGTQ